MVNSAGLNRFGRRSKKQTIVLEDALSQSPDMYLISLLSCWYKIYGLLQSYLLLVQIGRELGFCLRDAGIA